MRRLYIVTAFVLIMISASTGLGRADTARLFTSNGIISAANIIDGRRIAYRGEVIMVIMNRGDHSWVNLSDGDNALGIWCESDSLRDVRIFGGYKYRGDILEVEGVFHRACPIHGGELDIHADGVVMTARGFPIDERIDARKVHIAIALFVLVLLTVLILRKRL